MRNAKRLVFGGIAAVVFLAGCSSADRTVRSPLVAIPGSDVRGTLQVWSWNTAAKSLISLEPAFGSQSPRVHVTVDMTGEREETRLMLSLAAGVGAPDVCQMQDTDAPHYIAIGRMTDLTPVAAKYARLFPPAVWDNCLYHGRIYAIPWDIGPCAVFYKRDLFAKYGVDPNKIQTWDEYIAAGRIILTRSGGKTKMLPLGANDLEAMFELLLQQTGGQFFDESGNIAVDSPQAQQAIDLIRRMRSAGICSDIPAYGPEWMSGFNDSSIASYPGGVWLGGIIKDTVGDFPGKRTDWGVFRLPAVVPGGLRVANLGGSVLAIPDQCPNKAAAWAFIRYALCTREGQVAQYKGFDLFPSYLPALRDPYFRKPDAFFDGQVVGPLFARDITKIPTLNRTGNWAETSTYLDQDLSHWASLGMPPVDFLGDLAEKLHNRLGVPLASLRTSQKKRTRAGGVG